MSWDRETVELARSLGALPPRLVIIGVTGARFDEEPGLSPAVENVIPDLRELIRREIEQELQVQENPAYTRRS